MHKKSCSKDSLGQTVAFSNSCLNWSKDGYLYFSQPFFFFPEISVPTSPIEPWHTGSAHRIQEELTKVPFLCSTLSQASDIKISGFFLPRYHFQTCSNFLRKLCLVCKLYLYADNYKIPNPYMQQNFIKLCVTPPQRFKLKHQLEIWILFQDQ